MNKTSLTLALVFGKADFRENDSIVTLYSRDFGRLEAVARGAKKFSSKLSAHLEPFNSSSIMLIDGQSFPYIGAAVSEHLYLGIKNNWEKLVLASEAVKVFLSLVGEEDRVDAPALFDLWSSFLTALENCPDDRNELILTSFFRDLLVVLGYSPNWSLCAVCGSVISGERIFDFAGGACLCLGCRGRSKNLSCWQMLSGCSGEWLASKFEIDSLNEIMNAEILALFRKFLAYIK